MATAEKVSEVVTYRLDLNKDEAEVVATILNYAAAWNIKTGPHDGERISKQDMSSAYDVMGALREAGVAINRVHRS